MSEASHDERQNMNDARSAPGTAELRVRRLEDALSVNELARLASSDLAAFLLSKRWFGAKAGNPSSVRVRDARLAD